MLKYLFPILLCASPAFADVRLPRILGSHMVLQQRADVKLWGWATPGENIQVTGDWFGEPIGTRADADGKWQVRIQTAEAGGPHEIIIEANNTIRLQQILFGEVWIGSGQSNMEMPLIKVSGAYTGVQDADQEVAHANYPQIRLFQAGNFSSQDPLEDVEPGIVMYGIPPAKCEWETCSPKSVPNFSSTAYFFARHLHRELDVPIGIIDASWGGTSAEAWTPNSGLKRLEYDDDLHQAKMLPQKPDQKIPSRLYNGMIHPLRHFTIKGVIWYQGEGNATRADRYQELFSTMITEWRSAFGQDFPFYFVQIAPFGYRGVNAAYLRESQLRTMQSLARTGMAATMDIGNLTDIHPKNKQEVGRRLALWALANDYGREVVCSGPAYREAVREGETMRVKFDYAKSGLATNDGQTPSHLEVASEDRVFHPAVGTIDGSDLIVSCADVPQPRAVRYAFASEATPNLINKEGLPASSFRSDRW